jgi:hypothetical protein
MLRMFKAQRFSSMEVLPHLPLARRSIADEWDLRPS